MDLSPEDSLRLNVLLHQGLQAVRVDESRMVVYALTDRGEAKVPLNANCRDDQYIRHVKSLLSSHSLGSPGGYPVYLKRWTRMGQAKDDSLDQLLLLGEEEAVIAVVHASGLTNELARRAWWCSQTSDNARRMLEKQAVVEGDMGPELSAFLIEHLPFEDDALAMIDSVKVSLKHGLVTEEQKQNLWAKAKMKGAYYVGFLLAMPDDLPDDANEHALYASLKEKLQPLITDNNKSAALLLRVLSAAGQKYINVIDASLKRPSDQNVIVAIFMTIQGYFEGVCPVFGNRRDIQLIKAEATEMFAQCDDQLAELKQLAPETERYINAMMVLSAYSEELTFPIFGQTDAIGSVMRKRVKHLTDVIKEQTKILRS